MSILDEALDKARRSGFSEVDLSGIPLGRGFSESIPSFLWTLTREMKVLRLRNCMLEEVPPALYLLENLEILDLSGNRLSTLPPRLGSLRSLRGLDLSGNKLKVFEPVILQLGALEVLNLEYNQIEVVPDSLGSLEALDVVTIQGNPLFQPPAAVVARGSGAILAYMRGRLDPAAKTQWVSKLILVGEAAVGKTSVTRMLAGQPFDPDEPQTHGIRTTDLWFDHPRREVRMAMHTWDFGGQEIYHATHRFFLTDRSLFLCAFSSREGYVKGQIRTWLQAVTARAPGSPVIIVATHADEHPAPLPLAALREEFPMIVDFVSVDSKTGRGADKLRSAIAAAAASLPLMGNLWPRSWLMTSESLRALGEQQACVSPQVMRGRMMAAGIDYEEDQDTVAGVLHSLGELLFYADERELRDLIVVRPHWINEQITKLLDSEELLDRRGVLDRSLMERLWAPLEPTTRRFLVSMMEHVDLAYRMDPDDHEAVCLVVEKLAEDPADYLPAWENARAAGGSEIRLVYDFSAFERLQAGIPSWFIAREHRFTTGCHWRNGALLHSKAERAWALLAADPLTRRVELTVRGPYPVAFFSELMASFERILTTRYPGVPWTRLVPCPCELADGHRCPHLFEYDDLRRRLELTEPKEFIECPKSLRDVHVRGTIEGFKPQTLEEIRRSLHHMEAGLDGVADALAGIDSRQQLGLDFLRNVTAMQQAQEIQCPSLFLLTYERARLGLGKRTKLHFYCEYPLQWHPMQGPYAALAVNKPPAWFAPIAPHLRMIVRLLRQVAPIAGDLADVLGFPISDETKAAVELMKDFVDLVPEFPDSTLGREGASLTPRRLASKEGDFRWLARALTELDPAQRWGGLTRATTPDGLTVYVCEEHLADLRYPAH